MDKICQNYKNSLYLGLSKIGKCLSSEKRIEILDLLVQGSKTVESISNEMTARKDELCEMDALLGDGDLGLTMSKGFADLPTYIESLEEERVGKCISKCGMRFSGVIPSTMGFLLGSGFMNGGKAIGDSEEITAKEFSAFLGGFAEGIKKRGKCEVGDRTVLDSINTAYEYSKKALDDDNDGVPNDIDQCPNTPAGVVVDERGCEKVIVLRDLDVNFAFDSYKVGPKYAAEIKKVADFMGEHPDYKVVLAGHTDSVGAEAYNQKLSEKRAKAVADVLAGYGVSEDKISTVGYGELKPIATNKTKEGRAQNRRVEATFNK